MMAMEDVDKLVRNFYFMRKFGGEERHKLLQQGFCAYFDKGITIFHQGDIGDYMYIILKGAVGVRITAGGPKPEKKIVATLREGDQFGELALISNTEDKNKEQKRPRRRASCVCMEDSHLLGFPADVVNEVISELLTTKLKADIAFLQSLDYFCDLKDADLFPIISNMQKFTYTYGEYILREGDVPEGMYVVKEGQCLLCIESIGTRTDNSVSNVPLFEKKMPKKFKADKIGSRGFHNSILHMGKHNKELVYYNLIPVKSLYRYQTFGEHAIMSTHYIYKDGVKVMKVDSEPALFSVIADSASVELYLLTKDALGFLTRAQEVTPAHT